MDKSLESAVAVMLLAVIGSVVGCAGASSHGSSGGSFSRSFAPYAGGNAGPTRPKSPASTGNMITDAVKHSAATLTSVLTIKPKIIPAKDPVSLSSKPDKIGPDLYVSAARLYENRRDFVRARENYEKALETSPDDLPALLGLARLHHRQDRIEQAIALYRRALDSHPNNAVVLNDLGLCYERAHRIPESIEALSQAVRLEPGSKLYRNNIAAVLVEAGRADEALAHLTHAYGEAIAHYNLGHFLERQGDRAGALAQFHQAYRMAPSLVQARQMIERLGDVASPVQVTGQRSLDAGGRAPAPVLSRTPPTDRQFPEEAPAPAMPPKSPPSRQEGAAAWADPPNPSALQYPRSARDRRWAERPTAPPTPDQFGRRGVCPPAK